MEREEKYRIDASPENDCWILRREVGDEARLTTDEMVDFVRRTAVRALELKIEMSALIEEGSE